MQTFWKQITEFTSRMDQVIWGRPMLMLLLGTGIFLTIRLGFIQFRRFGWIMKKTVGKLFNPKENTKKGTLSPLQALTTALAGTVGTGNIAGVAGAIAIGGPGAIFWMWTAALFGMCTKYAEIVLAVHFRRKNKKGDFVGGPMYYIENGLGKKWHFLAVIFCVFGMVAALGTGCMTQINTIAKSIGSVCTSFQPSLDPGMLRLIYMTVGIIAAILTILVLFGGLQRIGNGKACADHGTCLYCGGIDGDSEPYQSAWSDICFDFQRRIQPFGHRRRSCRERHTECDAGWFRQRYFLQ